MKKMIKYLLAVIVLGLLGYKSVYIKKLSTMKKSGTEKFDAADFVQKKWAADMPAKLDAAAELPVLMKAMAADKEAALKQYTNAIDIGNYRYAIIKTQATVVGINEDDMQLALQLPDSTMNAVLATEYIYGNAVRDASAVVDIKDFTNSTDLNNISEEMNKILRTTVIPPFKAAVKKGDKLSIVAAIELNKEHIKWPGIELMPLRLQIEK